MGRKRDSYIDRQMSSECEEVGGWVFVISLELIPWEQMVNGGLPTGEALVCVHAARSSSEVEEDVVRRAHEAGLLGER